MKIQILGTGCPKCNKLAANAQEAIQQAGIEAEVVKITDINEIADFGVAFTPGLAIDGEIKSSGKLLTVEQIVKILQQA